MAQVTCSGGGEQRAIVRGDVEGNRVERGLNLKLRHILIQHRLSLLQPGGWGGGRGGRGGGGERRRRGEQGGGGGGERELLCYDAQFIRAQTHLFLS